MNVADRIYALVQSLPLADAERVLRYAQDIKGSSAMVTPAVRRIDIDVFRPFRGLYDGARISRESLYDRAGLR